MARAVRGNHPSPTTPARKLTASTTLPPGCPPRAPDCRYNDRSTETEPISVWYAPHTVPRACTEPRRSPLRERLCPDSSALRRGLLTPSWTPLLRSPLPPLHNPLPSPHPADPRFAAAAPNVR